MPLLGDDLFAPQFLWPKDKGHSNVRPRICSFKLLKNESKKLGGHVPLGTSSVYVLGQRDQGVYGDRTRDHGFSEETSETWETFKPIKKNGEE